jgi:DNA-binding GntR family transcriptional regulator
MSNASLKDKTIQSIMNKIHEFEISKDAVLTEADICKMFKISRTPAREALIELTANGVLTKIPNRGYAISELSEQAKLEIFDLIGCLDSAAAKLAIPFLDSVDLMRMREILDMIDVAIKYENYKKYYDLQEEFHDVYISKCNNEQVIKMLNRAKSSVSEFWKLNDNHEDTFVILGEVNKEHREILRLFEEKDICGLRAFIEDVHWATKEFVVDGKVYTYTLC